MVKNKSRLATKLFIIVWIVLAIHIMLKLTFNYWQPYIIPNDRLQAISDFIDDNSIIKIILTKLKQKLLKDTQNRVSFFIFFILHT